MAKRPKRPKGPPRSKGPTPRRRQSPAPAGDRSAAGSGVKSGAESGPEPGPNPAAQKRQTRFRLPAVIEDEDLPRLRNTALKLHKDDRHEEALVAYTAYLARRPHDSGMWCNLGVSLRKQQKFLAASACYHRAIEIKADDSSYWGNLGNVLKDLDEVEASLAAHRKAVELSPGDQQLLYNYGIAFRDGGRFPEALEVFKRCLEMDDSHPNLNWDRALALLHLEHFEEGWKAYEWRWKIGELKAPVYPAPPWRGEDLRGKTILLYPEQGFGDTLLVTRFIPLLKARGATVILECKDRLRRLFDGLEGVDRLIGHKSARGGFDYHCPMMSLPGLLGATPDTLPAPLALNIPDSSRKKADALLAPAGARLKVGIVWSGSVTYKGNLKRSVSIARFLDLARVPGVQLYSLYKGPLEHELVESGASAVIVDLGSQDEDFADAAAIVEALDLVVMTDSAIAHLTGTLGRPVWNLLAYSPYWLYLPQGDTTPWYSSMRLYRQPEPGDWDPVFERVKGDLSKAVAAKRAGQWPPASAADDF